MVTAAPIVKSVARWALAVTMIGVGIAHFWAPDPFVRMMPAALPLHLELVWISGFFEVLGGVGLLWERSRLWAGWGLIALYICVFPSNINMAVHGIMPEGVELPIWLLWARLPFQAVFIGWAFWVSRADPGVRSEGSSHETA
jgi:uncharacterized membrane protein